MNEYFQMEIYEKDGETWVRGVGLLKDNGDVVDPEIQEDIPVGEVVDVADDGTATVRL